MMTRKESNAMAIVLVFWAVVIMCYQLDVGGIRDLVDRAPGMSDKVEVLPPEYDVPFAMSDVLVPMSECSRTTTSSMVSWAASALHEALNISTDDFTKEKALDQLRKRFDQQGFVEFVSYIAKKVPKGSSRNLYSDPPGPMTFNVDKIGETEAGCVWYVKVPMLTDLEDVNGKAPDETWRHAVSLKIIQGEDDQLRIAGWRTG